MWVLSHVQLFVTPWTVAHQAPLSMGFSRHEYWSGCYFLLQGIFPTRDSLHLSSISCIDRHIFYQLHQLGSSRLVKQAIQRLFVTVKRSSAVIVHWIAYRNPLLTWEWAFPGTNWSWNVSQILVKIKTKREGIVKWRMLLTIQFYKNQVIRHCSHWPKVHSEKNSELRAEWGILYSRKTDRTDP